MKFLNYFKGVKLLTFIFLVSIVTTILSIVYASRLMNTLNLVNEATTNRGKSLALAYELKQSSTDLTHFARLYVETKHPRYKYYYYIVKGIRDGKIKKPSDYKDYGNFYWDVKTPDVWVINQHEPDSTIFLPCDDCLSFRERMIELGFDDLEFELLSEAQSISDSLSVIEEEAFQIVEDELSYYDFDGDNNYYMEVLYSDPFIGELELRTSTLTKEANNSYAKYLLFNPFYLKSRSDMMIPITEFKEVVDTRTQETLDYYQDLANDYLLISVILSMASLLFLCTLGVVIFITRNKNDKLLFNLNKKNTYLEHAAKILRHDMHSGINVYIPRGVSSLKRRLGEDDIKNLKIGAPLQMISEGLKHTRKVYKGVYEFTNLVKKDAVMNKEDHNIKDILTEFLSHTSYKSQVILDDNLPTANVNESLFCTAVDNLIRNGLKYNDSDTKIVKVYFENGCICVEDNGRGMSQKDFDYLSQPYARREGQKEGGMGLGLNICNSILEEHGFSISVEKLQLGTKIKIYI